MAYNVWYSHTYEPILSQPYWKDFCSEPEMKLVCVFSWMPQAIMNIKTTGGGTKAETYGIAELKTTLKEVAPHFGKLQPFNLREIALKQHQEVIQDCFRPLFRLMGSVAASKWLHFSAPHLFPMWDRGIRLQYGLEDSPEGYFNYMSQFQKELSDEKVYSKALKKYPDNPVRGLDILRMEQSRE